MAKPLWLISYDICCPKRLKKVQKYCAKNGWTVQKSIFLFAWTRSEREDACSDLISMIEREEDKLLCLPFSTLEGSFHHTPPTPILFIHDDPRLTNFIY